MRRVLARSYGAGRQGRVWDRRAAQWSQGTLPGLAKVIAAVVGEAGSVTGCSVVDLGCGPGEVGLTLVRAGATLLAVDFSQNMIALLKERVIRDRLTGVATLVCAIEDLALPERSVDLVVSSYALHHLRDKDKERVVARAARWLRPGGRLIVGDMMFGRGMERRDRAIIGGKVIALARRGPPGWWRIVKNGWRFLTRTQERPVSMRRWEEIFGAAGLIEVRAYPVVAEAAVVSGRVQEAGPPVAVELER